MYRIRRRRHITYIILGLWQNWAVAVGLLTFVSVISIFISLQSLAIVTLAAFVIVRWILEMRKRRGMPSNSRLIQLVSTVLLLTGLALIGVYFFAKSGNAREITGQPFTLNVPMLTILITAPLTIIVTIFYLITHKQDYAGQIFESNAISTLVKSESRSQKWLLLGLEFCLALIAWLYYLILYINTNLTKTDMLVFSWIPIIIYALSIIYLGARYYNYWLYYCNPQNDDNSDRKPCTTLRYLIICNDKIFLHFRPIGEQHGNGVNIKRFDTPAIARIDYREFEDLGDAQWMFRHITGIDNAEIRLIFSIPDNITNRNTFNYFAFIDNPAVIADSKINGEWFTWDNINRLNSQYLLTAQMAKELRKIYDVAMAWKTYDINGYRLHPIKHYHPTFRVRDLKNWEVDYNDPQWLVVSQFNQDSRLFRLRNLLGLKPQAKQLAKNERMSL